MILKTLITISAVTNVGAVVLDEKTPVTIGAVVAFGGLIWYLGTMIQKIKDDTQHQSKDIQHLSMIVHQMTQAINKLPCRDCYYIEDRPKGEDDSA